MRIALLLVVASVGCTRDDAITCEKATDMMPFVLLPDRPDVASVSMWEMRGNLEGVLAYRCRTDRWNAEARACMVRAMNRAGFDECAKQHLDVHAKGAFENVLANEGLIPAVRAEVPVEAAPIPRAGSTGIPECDAYKMQVDRFTECERIPAETRKQLLDAFEQASSAWSQLPAESRPAVAEACKHATDAVRQATASCP